LKIWESRKTGTGYADLKILFIYRAFYSLFSFRCVCLPVGGSHTR